MITEIIMWMILGYLKIQVKIKCANEICNLQMHHATKYKVPMHTLKTHGKAKLHLHLFLGLAVDGGDLSASHLAHFTPMRLGGP